MPFLPRHFLSVLPAAIALSLANYADLAAQVSNDARSNAAVQEFIGNLNSPNFRIRKQATDSLMKVGDSAVAPLKNALPNSSLEQRLRIKALLNRLEQNSFRARVARLKSDPRKSLAADLPEWGRFSTLVGTDPQSIAFFVRILSAEPALFAAADNDPLQLRLLLESRSSEVLQSTGPAQRKNPDQFSVDSYAALLLLASNNDNVLRRDTSTSISALLSYSEFTTALKSEDGNRYLQLASAWILRKRIGVEQPIEFARRHPMNAGLELARRTLKTALRGQNGRLALTLLSEQGDESDLPLLESLFAHRGVITRGSRTSRRYKAYNGDMALAVALTLRGEDPRDYGFGRTEPRDEAFRFALETIGFESDESREQALNKYMKRFKPAKAM